MITTTLSGIKFVFMKHLNWPLLLLGSVIVCGCTADGMNEEESSSKSKAQILKTRILELADDYDLKIICHDDYLACHVDEINLDSIEKKFKGLAKIKGTYPLKVTKSKKGSSVSFRQGSYRTTRVSSFDNKNETYECNEDFLVDMNMYYCKCRVDWSFTYYGKSDGGTICASVSQSPFSNDTSQSYDDINYRDSGYGIIFGGPVVYKENGFDTRFYVSGEFDVNGGIINWSM